MSGNIANEQDLNPAKAYLCIHPVKMLVRVYKETSRRMFIIAHLAILIANTCKQSKCSSTGGWVNYGTSLPINMMCIFLKTYEYTDMKKIFKSAGRQKEIAVWDAFS